MKRSLGTLSLAGSLALAACGGTGPSGNAGEDVGTARLAVSSVPSGVGCLTLEASAVNRTATRTFTLIPGAPVSDLVATGLPVGTVQILAAADTACGSVSSASWVSDAQFVTLSPGVTTVVDIVLHPNGGVAANVGFEGDVTCPAGRFFSGDAGVCTPCPEGFFSAPNATSCTACPPGEYAASIGASECLPCPPGSQATLSGQSACTPALGDADAAPPSSADGGPSESADGGPTCPPDADCQLESGVSGLNNFGAMVP